MTSIKIEPKRYSGMDVLAREVAAGIAANLARALDELSDPDRARRYEVQARAWAERFSWDDSARRLAHALLAEMRYRELGRPRARRARGDAASAAMSVPSGA